MKTVKFRKHPHFSNYLEEIICPYKSSMLIAYQQCGKDCPHFEIVKAGEGWTTEIRNNKKGHDETNNYESKSSSWGSLSPEDYACIILTCSGMPVILKVEE
jgi:hypothetical protein